MADDRLGRKRECCTNLQVDGILKKLAALSFVAKKVI